MRAALARPLHRSRFCGTEFPVHHHHCVALILLAACGPAVGISADIPTATTAANDWSVVGGSLETRFPAIGYMMTSVNGDALAGPNCGATLVAPNVAITAAHCVWSDKVTSFASEKSVYHDFGFQCIAKNEKFRRFLHPLNMWQSLRFFRFGLVGRFRF